MEKLEISIYNYADMSTAIENVSSSHWQTLNCFVDSNIRTQQ